jgi:uncharacterized protein (TIGR02453 family)
MPPKRKLEDTSETANSARRRSTRLTTSASAKKSKYFEDDSEDELSQAERTPVKARQRPNGAPKVKGTSGRRTPAKRKNAESEDEDGEDAYQEAESEAPAEVSEEEYDSDAPPKVTFIPLPKLRATNGIPYTDETLHPNTLLFLRDLKAHNQRPWLKSHDEEYRRALKDWESYVTTLTTRLIDLDPTIPELPLRDVIFRIYRDTRFSKDPTPYKPHFSAAWSRTGRKGPYACYYVHVEPDGKCMVGGGLWSPEAGSVGRLRASIDERPHRWRRVLGADGFGRMFFGREAGKGGDEGAVKRFVDRNQMGALKTKPKVSISLF